MDSLQKAKQYTAEIMVDNCVVGFWIFFLVFVESLGKC